MGFSDFPLQINQIFYYIESPVPLRSTDGAHPIFTSTKGSKKTNIMKAIFTAVSNRNENKVQFNLKSKLMIVVIAILMMSSFSVQSTADSHEDYCLTCLIQVERANAICIKYHGQKFYFDDDNCASKFKANPGKYVSSRPRFF